MFVLLGCSKSEEQTKTDKTQISSNALGKIELQIEGYTSFDSTPFTISILDSNAEMVKKLDDLSSIPKFIELEDGQYSLYLESVKPQIITAEVNLFKGISEEFIINGSGDLSIRLIVEKEAFKGWVEVPNVPLDMRSGAASFIIEGTIFIGLGFNSSNEPLNDWWSYAIDTNIWTKLDNFPGGGRTYVTPFSIGPKGYLCMGYTESPENLNIELKELWEYDSQTNIWSQKADFTGIFRNETIAFVAEGKAYVGTGSNNGITTLSDFYQYDPTLDLWSPDTDVIGDPTYGFGSFSLKGKGHLFGGTINGNERTNQHYVYNPSNASWTELSPAPGEPRLEGTGFVIQDIGYYGLGSITNNSPGFDLWKYDDQEDTWTEVSNFPGLPRFAPVAGSNNDLGYYGFGTSAKEFNDFYLYYPEDE